MESYTKEELTQALTAVESIIRKCKAAQRRFPEGTSHHTLLKRRLNAMYLSRALICRELETDGKER